MQNRNSRRSTAFQPGRVPEASLHRPGMLASAPQTGYALMPEEYKGEVGMTLLYKIEEHTRREGECA